jgi:putative endonuclease
VGRAGSSSRDARRQRQHAAQLEGEIADLSSAPNRIGARAETAAVRALEAEGYQIIARNWSVPLGELDIVARDRDARGRDVLVFVEVRSRDNDDHGSAVEAVTPAKRRKVTKVAAMYLLIERPVFELCRFDVVAITGGVVELIKDAWRTG